MTWNGFFATQNSPPTENLDPSAVLLPPDWRMLTGNGATLWCKKGK